MTEPFKTLTAPTIGLPQEDIDTDQIVPARFLTITDKSGLKEACFHDWRFDETGNPKGDGPFAAVDGTTPRILVAGYNFGCGSSREHAPWALRALGIRVVISSRIADIFASNAAKNGIVTATVDGADLALLLNHAPAPLTVNLESTQIGVGDAHVPFSIEPFARHCLLAGTDPLSLLLAARDQIGKFEKEHGR